ncbi:MAG: hypothetical protein M3N21_08970, partial [Actinomycetota bacterium]|nr:hypothetical protein [Actinomycetota bacterium]
PARLSRLSPLGARLIGDGAHLRAIIGSAWSVVVLAGLVTGVVAGLHVGALPAPTALPVAVALALGAVDAFAGAAAACAFIVTLLATGAISSSDGLRGALGVAALWFALPLLTGETRPLRRQPLRTAAQRWYRAGDFVVLPPLGAWLTFKLIKALPGLYGHAIPLGQYAGRIALVAGVALLMRLTVEELATRLYPVRLTEVTPEALPAASTAQRLASVALKTTFFVFVAIPFVGVRPELAIGAGLFAFPQFVKPWESRLPKVTWLHRVLPRGIVKITALVVIGFYAAAYLGRHIHDTSQLAAAGFLALSVPPAVIALLGLVAPAAPAPPATWRRRALGAATVSVAGLVIYRLSVV